LQLGRGGWLMLVGRVWEHVPVSFVVCQAKPTPPSRKKNLDMKHRILITGGTGFIGHALVRRLAQREEVEVVAADLAAPVLPPSATHEAVRIAQLRRQQVAEVADTAVLDVRDEAAVSALVREVSPTVVVQLSAVAAADAAEREPELARQVNVDGLRNVIGAVSGRDTRLVFISSSFVYGDFETPVVDERHPLRPKGVYGETKFEGEQLVRSASALADVKGVIVRPSAVYGPYDTNRRVVQTILEQARAQEPSTIRGGGGSLDFTYVDDLAAGLELASFHPSAPGRTFNLTAGKGRSLRELIEGLRRHYPEHVVHEAPADPSKPKRGTLDVSHARMVLGYQPIWDLESGLDTYVDFYRSVVDNESVVG
jgi:nucleoside-diphosphate-sugar epimerase